MTTTPCAGASGDYRAASMSSIILLEQFIDELANLDAASLGAR